MTHNKLESNKVINTSSLYDSQMNGRLDKWQITETLSELNRVNQQTMRMTDIRLRNSDNLRIHQMTPFSGSLTRIVAIMLMWQFLFSLSKTLTDAPRGYLGYVTTEVATSRGGILSETWYTCIDDLSIFWYMGYYGDAR